MDHLPFEMQWSYLLELPIQDVLSYCQASQTTYGICQNDLFWKVKARQIYDVDLDIVPWGNAMQKYNVLESQYLSLDADSDSLLIIDNAILTRSTLKLEEILRFYKYKLASVKNTGDILRGAFLGALFTHQPEMMKILRKWYDPVTDKSEDIEEWIWQYRMNNDQEKLDLIASLGLPF